MFNDIHVTIKRIKIMSVIFLFLFSFKIHMEKLLKNGQKIHKQPFFFFNGKLSFVHSRFCNAAIHFYVQI